MMKYKEDHYLYKNIKDKIYPWVKESLVDHKALNGKYVSDKDTPIVSFAGDLMVIFVIERDKDTYENIKRQYASARYGHRTALPYSVRKSCKECEICNWTHIIWWL